MKHMDEEENDGGSNSEIRFIALELMNLAQKSGKTFDQVALEYMENACKLQKLIATSDSKPRKSKARE